MKTIISAIGHAVARFYERLRASAIFAFVVAIALAILGINIKDSLDDARLIEDQQIEILHKTLEATIAKRELADLENQERFREWRATFAACSRSPAASTRRRDTAPAFLLHDFTAE